MVAVTAVILTTLGFVLLPGAGASAVTSVFGDDVRPTVTADSDHASVELGLRFSPLSPGRVTALRYYQSSSNLRVSQVTLWSADGRVLGRAPVEATDVVGWRTIQLPTSVALVTGETYVVSYHATRGVYPVKTGDLLTSRTQNGFDLDAGAGVYAYGSTSALPWLTYQGSNYLVDVVYETGLTSPGAPASGSTSATPTKASGTPAPTTTAAPPTPSPSGGSKSGFTVLGRTFPSSENTGVPSGTKLAAYTGPCTIQTNDTVIDAMMVDCDLRIFAQRVTITRSVVNGSVYTNADDSSGITGSFTISDSEVRMPQAAATGIGDANFTATRVEVTGGSRSVNCFLNCTMQDSFVHDQYTDTRGLDHESGVRMGSGSVLRHNTIGCTAPDVPPDAGCSAAITGYGDFAIVQKNTIDNNLILAGSGGYCSYGGSTAGKPYSIGVNSIKFTNNVWQKGESGQCGYWGPITSFDEDAPLNVWTNNLYDDGKPVEPAN